MERPDVSKYDLLYIMAAKFNFFEALIGRYSYTPILEPRIKEYLIENPVETLIDFEDEEHEHMQLF